METNVETIETRPTFSGIRRIIFGKHPDRTLIRLCILLVVTFVSFRYILLPIQVSGISMSPTYRNGAVNMVNKLSYARSEPRRGDVVALRVTEKRAGETPENVLFLKRIVGLPGEEIMIKYGKLYVNGERCLETYPHTTYPISYKPRKLEDWEYFVIGDNRRDSVALAVEKKQIIGKVLF
jgi:signal peptidase I